MEIDINSPAFDALCDALCNQAGEKMLEDGVYVLAPETVVLRGNGSEVDIDDVIDSLNARRDLAAFLSAGGVSPEDAVVAFAEDGDFVIFSHAPEMEPQDADVTQWGDTSLLIFYVGERRIAVVGDIS